MHKDGHAGISLLLTSPFVAIFLVLELYEIAVIFVTMVLVWSGLPDIDIYLQEYEPVSFSSYPIRHWEWVPLMRMTALIMNFSGKYISKVPTDYEMKKITHRGLTHSLWFSIAFGFVASALAATALLGVIVSDQLFNAGIYLSLADVLRVNPIYLIPLSFVSGFLSVCFHCVGDVFTPTGIHFLTTRTDYGYTFDLFYAKNEVANRSALPIGIIMISYACFFGYFFGQISTLYLIGGFIGLFTVIVLLWLVFVKTPIGKWFYIVYDFLK